MLDRRIIKQSNARGRAVKKVDSLIKNKRFSLCKLIDEYWIYWKNPNEYTYSKKVKDKITNIVSEVWSSGKWPHRHHIIRKEKNTFVISIKCGKNYLPLTPRGDEELVINASESNNIEEILANIKNSINKGKADKWL